MQTTAELSPVIVLKKQLAIVTILLLGACATHRPTPSPDVPSSELQSLDVFEQATEQQSSHLRQVNLGKTQAADNLVGFYDKEHLAKVVATYSGEPPVVYTLYLRSSVAPRATDALVVGDLEATGLKRYYLLSDHVWVQDGNSVRTAVEREANDVHSLVKQYIGTFDRAARGEFDNPAAFEQE